MMRVAATIFFLQVMFFLVGCSTLQVHATHATKTQPLYPYAGTKSAITKFYKSFDDYQYYGQVYVKFIDIPLCLAADTVLLPYGLFVLSKD